MVSKVEVLKRSLESLESELNKAKREELLSKNYGWHLNIQRTHEPLMNEPHRIFYEQPQESLGNPLGSEYVKQPPTILSSRQPTSSDKGFIGQVWMTTKVVKSGNCVDDNFRCTDIERIGDEATYKWEPLKWSIIEASKVRYHFSADRSCELCHMRMTNNDICNCRTTMRCARNKCGQLISNNKPCDCSN